MTMLHETLEDLVRDSREMIPHYGYIHAMEWLAKRAFERGVLSVAEGTSANAVSVLGNDGYTDGEM